MKLNQTKLAKALPLQVSHKMVIGIAFPMTLAYLTVPLLGLVDTAVVGRLGDPALIGGLAVGAVIIGLLFATFNFLRSGTTGLTAQAFGAGNEKEIQATLFRAVLIATVSGMIIVVVSPWLISASLYFMDPGTQVANATQKYLSIRILAAPLNLANFAILGWLVGLGRAGWGLLLQFLLNGINIILSILLGLNLGYGIEGVAWATVISEVIAAMVGVFICWKLLDHKNRPSRARVFERSALLRFANLTADIMLRSFVLLFTFAFFTAQGASFGENTLAANAVLMNFFMFGGYFLDGLATAAEQIVGQAIGANNKAAFLRGMKLTTFWNFILGAGLALIFLYFGDLAVGLITTLESVRVEANKYLIFAALTPLTGVLAFQMDGVFIGATWSREMSKMMLASFVVFICSWWLLKSYENVGLWLALHVFLLARGILLSVRLAPKIKASF
ncbi:MAG: MATE family efflux transporter [Rhizobiales bacterium]|nr:MATE family efflux transporter [Hyphomicrobiales bacterium]